VIESFKDKDTAAVWTGRFSRHLPPDIQARALRKLQLIDAARKLDDLNVPPNNRLEALKGDRAGQHSIRINDQWRVCFTWRDSSALDVEIVDYHCRLPLSTTIEEGRP